MPKLSIHLVVRNEEQYLPFLLASLKRQTFKDFEIICIDNCSADKTNEIIKKELDSSGIKYSILRNEANIGFASGHNQAYKISSAPYVLLQNADVYLMPETIEKMVEFLDNHQSVAAVAPRLMRWNFELARAAMLDGSELLEAAKKGFTSQIDSIGICLFRNRRALEWLTKQNWAKDSENKEVRMLYEKPVKEVFGVSGAMAMYRKKMLDEIIFPEENIFDPTFHSYKEDLDLAYRLQNAGHISCILLNCLAYHDRTSAGPENLGDISALKNKKQQSYFTRFYSYKNHLKTLYKNEYWQNFFLDFPFIFWYEFKKIAYLSVKNPRILFLSFIEIIKEFSRLRAARRMVLKNRRMHWKGIRRWLKYV
jgi:GT2 family glycosyltransferase